MKNIAEYIYSYKINFGNFTRKKFGGMLQTNYIYDNFEQSLSFDAWERRRDPLVGRMLSSDKYIQCPENSQNFNRYAYCANNPIKYVDPTGEEQIRVNDNYTVDDEGYIKLVEKTNDDCDVIYTKDSWDKGEKDNYIIVDKNVLSRIKTNSAEGIDGKKYSFDMYSVNDDITSKNLFEFLANNTKVEWSQTFIGLNNSGKSIISTSHVRNAEAGQGYLFSNGWTIRGHNHSHPFSNNPSLSDKRWASSVQTKFSKVKLQIYFKGEYFEYDKYGILNLPFSNIPEVIIKPEDK